MDPLLRHGFYLDDDLSFDRGIAAERRNSDGCSSMLTTLTPEFNQQVRFAVYDLGHILEPWSNVDESGHLYNTLNQIQIT